MGLPLQVKVDQGVKAMKFPTVPRSPEIEPHQMQDIFFETPKILWGF